MNLVTIDLPAPSELRGRWAALAAVCAARGWGEFCHADGARWHHDDGGGNWADLTVLDGGRAVLVGNDHEYTETYWDRAATLFVVEKETDLLAGAPGWWSDPAHAGQDRNEMVGFVYGYDGRWQRAAYDAADGFSSLGLPMLSDEATAEGIRDLVEDAPGRSAPPLPADIAAVITAGTEVTREELAAVVGPVWDVAAGGAAARAFGSP